MSPRRIPITCTPPAYCGKKIQDRAAEIRKRAEELSIKEKTLPAQRAELAEQAIEGRVSGVDFLERSKAIADQAGLMIDVETAPLYHAKLALEPDVTKAASKEADKLNKQADERRAELEQATAGFEGRPADREALIRSDQGIQQLKRAAIEARSAAKSFITQQDRAWFEDYQARVKAAVDLKSPPMA